MKKKIYIIENLDCANCAAKIENKISKLEQVQEVSITYATKQLRITAENPDELIPTIQKICNSLEPDVKIIEKDKYKPSEHLHEHHDHEHCSCNHDHHHHEHECNDYSCCEHHEHHHNDEHQHEHEEENNDLLQIIISVMLFIGGLIISKYNFYIGLVIYVIAYLILGSHVLITAIKNLFKGQVLDENFLMSIATLGAFAIQEFPEAVGVMLFYRVGEFFEDKAVEKSRKQIMSAVDMRPETVTLVTGDNLREIKAEEANIGDILLVKPGDKIPLDSTVIEGESRLDTSPITGEPVPVKVSINDSVISGCINTSGVLKIKVNKLLEESMVTRILESVENAASSKPKIDKFITKFARIYTPFVVISALLIALIPSFITGEWSKWIYTALTFLVISCPCALVLSVPLAYFAGIGVGSKKGILFKGGLALEALKDIKVIAMDKTGTITKGNFVLQKVITESSVSSDNLLSLAASCEVSSTHPIALSIVNAAKEKNLELQNATSINEVAGNGIKAKINNDIILCGNEKLMESNKIKINSSILNDYGTKVFIAVNGSYLGCLIISDTIKDDSKASIDKIKKLGIKTAILTGDSNRSAEMIGEAVNVDKVYAELLPDEKLSTLSKLREEYGSTMFVGDGINDAPVLAAADVSAAMGSGADAAIEASDVVFMNSNVESIVESITIASKTNRISLQNIIFALAIKAAVLILGILGLASMWVAVFADTGVAILCILNSIRLLYSK